MFSFLVLLRLSLICFIIVLLKAYTSKAKRGEIFLAQLVDDLIDKTHIKTFGQFYEKLKSKKQYSQICKLIEEKQNGKKK